MIGFEWLSLGLTVIVRPTLEPRAGPGNLSTRLFVDNYEVLRIWFVHEDSQS